MAYNFLPKSGFHAQQAIIFGAFSVFISGILITLSEVIKEGKETCKFIVICILETDPHGIKIDLMKLIFLVVGIVGTLQMFWGLIYYIFLLFGVKRNVSRNVPVRIYTIFGTRKRIFHRETSVDDDDLPSYTELK